MMCWMGGRPQLLMDIHSVSEVDRPDIDLVKNRGTCAFDRF